MTPELQLQRALRQRFADLLAELLPPEKAAATLRGEVERLLDALMTPYR